ncbi:MAG: flagellar biosynthetic protein FliO, partial [Oscillospiraceae bacterium]
ATVSGAKNIEILDKVALNQNQVLLIVKVCGKTMLLGSTENGITNLGEVDAEKLNNPPEIQPFSFSTILENIKNQKNGEERQQTDDRNVK